MSTMTARPFSKSESRTATVHRAHFLATRASFTGEAGKQLADARNEVGERKRFDENARVLTDA